MRVVKSLLQRCAEVVEFMAAHGEPCRLSAIAQALDVPKSATHRLLREMLALGWMEQDGPDGPYRLSLHFALLGHRVLRGVGLPDLVQPLLDGLAADTRELVRLTIATSSGATSSGATSSDATGSGSEDWGLMWFAAAQGAPPGLLYQPATDGPVVLHATANGKAFLASLDDEAALRLAVRGGLGVVVPTDGTLRTVDGLLADLGQIRARGYAVAAEEAEPGITAVAVAVVAQGRAVGTLSVAGPSLRIEVGRIPALGALLARVAGMLAAVWPSVPLTTQREMQP